MGLPFEVPDLLCENIDLFLSFLLFFVDIESHLFLFEALMKFEALMQVFDDPILFLNLVIQISYFLRLVGLDFSLEGFNFLLQNMILSHFDV